MTMPVGIGNGRKVHTSLIYSKLSKTIRGEDEEGENYYLGPSECSSFY